MLASCGRAPEPQPKPLYGGWGFDAAGENKETKAGDDFFRFANGTWLDHTQVPADESAVSLRLQMTDRTEASLHDMMEQSAAHSPHQPADLEGKMGAFYKLFMDEALVEHLGAKPITEELADVRSAKTRGDLGSLAGRNPADFEGTLFSVYIDADLKDPEHYAVYVTQAGLGLPDRDYYLQKQFAAQKKKYQEYVAQVLHLVDWPDAGAHAKDVVDFVTQIAKANWTKAQQRDTGTTYNPMSIKQLRKFAPGFAWAGFFEEAGLAKTDRVIVAEKSAFPKLAAIWAQTPAGTLQHGTLCTSSIMPRRTSRRRLPTPISTCMIGLWQGRKSRRYGGSGAYLR